MKKIKDAMFSDNGRKIANAIFFLSILFPASGFTLIAYICWEAYLVCCIKRSETKSGKIIYGIFSFIVFVLILINISSFINFN